MIKLSATSLDPTELQTAFCNTSQGSGGIVSFIGNVRPNSVNGAVQKLELQAYSPMTENLISKEVNKAIQLWSLQSAWVVHRIGSVLATEPIVFVATASKHRRAAFEAADFLMDYLKTRAIFWKKEVTATGEYWIEPRGDDYSDAARWNQLEDVVS